MANLKSLNIDGDLILDKGTVPTNVETVTTTVNYPFVYIYNFTANTITHMSSTYTVNGQSVVMYEDETDSDKGYYVVATTVNANTITYGTAAHAAGTYTVKGTSCAYDYANGKVLMAAAQPGGNHIGAMYVGTISGTGTSATMSWGNGVQTNSGSMNAPDGAHKHQGIVWVGGIGGDTTNRLVMVMLNDNNALYGRGTVVTISGTTPSVAGWANFTSAGQGAADISMAYVGNGQVVVAYGEDAVGRCKVGTITGGSTLTWSTNWYAYAGTHVNPGSEGCKNSIAYDQNAGKFIIAYIDSSVNVRGRAIVGTVSGTGTTASIAFGTEQEFTTGSGAVDAISVVYNTAAQKSLITYNPTGSGNPAAVVATITGTDVAFTSQVYLATANPKNTVSVYDTVNKKNVVFWGHTSAGIGIVVDLLESALTIDLSTGNYFELDLETATSDIISFTITESLSGAQLQTFDLKVTQGSVARDFRWGSLSNFKFPGGTHPILPTTNNAVSILRFTTYDAGTTWIAKIVGQNFT